MKLEESLKNFLVKHKHGSHGESPEGLCPNCWGTQEYEGKFYEAVRNWDADVKTKDIDAGWIRDYVKKHLFPISLKQQEEGKVCENCKVIYKEKK
ncbi:hypothetical protein SAMN06265375_1011504 [Muriicola jejuensis]|uniref:Uncharacterized protein n=1 Tax=Muriicola jejuensis TaxID=504488 RepID=A0A6P0U7B6_9FLAO|nr:hypothetical protein [Muriicola jejuensis]NER09015.1 hypothetical protein [Muriicola jejuensis]SMP12102.1 hypothetical protein SAMN06265375_1011504 [Muriicola jejuensis]